MKTLLVLALAAVSTSTFADHYQSNHRLQQSQATISTYQQSSPATAIDYRRSHRGEVEEASEQRSLAEFDRIHLEIPATVSYQPGDTNQLELSAEKNLLGIISSEVIDGALVISARESFSTTVPIHIKLTSATLEAVAMNASGEIKINGINSASLQLRVTGSGKISISGQSTELITDLIGSGNIDSQELFSQRCRINLQGSGIIQSYCGKHISAQLLGSGTIAISGSPASRQLSGWGAGQIFLEDD